MLNTKNLADNLALIKTFADGYGEFARTGVAPTEAYLAMRQLFVRSDGRFNDLFQSVYRIAHPAIADHDAAYGTLGITAAECDQALRGLREDGFFVFQTRLADELVSELMDYGLRTPARLQKVDQPPAEEEACFDPANVIATNYRIAEAKVINFPVAQRIMCDAALLNIAQRYIASQIHLVNAQMWWTTPYECSSPSPQLAQMYHFDMDRIKFLKLFIYLTDVGPHDGPHCYVRGSAPRKPKSCHRDGRFTDEELAREYPASDFVEITGPKGTILAVDTRGFHKAKVPTSGNRLIFQLEWANSLFGQYYGRPRLIVKSAELRASLARDPKLLANYAIENAAAPAVELVGNAR
jgi:hypothetical protein